MIENIPLPMALKTLAALWSRQGAVLYGVGGIVRNGLLGLPPSDLDICSAMLPQGVLELCRAQGIPCIPKALQFGTVEIHYQGLKLEHTTFRGQEEYEAGGSHRPRAVTLGAEMEQDAFRRDFTCNAMYIEILSGDILDPTMGKQDVSRRILRATTPDPHVILQDDGLRVLRLVRFACELGFAIEENTWAAAKDCVAGLGDIAWERKREELSKILLSDVRYPALHQGHAPVLYGLHLLHEIGALPYVLPELLEGEGVPQRPQYHRYEVMEHNFHACAAAPPQLTLRLAALLHDVGKPAALREKQLPMDAGGHACTPGELALPRGVTPMLGHDSIGAQMALCMLERLRYPKKIAEEAADLIAHHMYDLNGKAKENTLRARFAGWGYEHSLALCALREADVRGSGYETQWVAKRWREVLENMQREGAPFSEGQLCCTGKDIMEWLNIPPGPAVGEIKRKLLLHCARYPKDNTPERLKKAAQGMNAPGSR